MDPKHFICACYFTYNIFLHDYKLHVIYRDDDQLAVEYKDLLQERGCDNEEKFKKVLTDVKEEIARRRKKGEEHVYRCQLVKQKYKRLHPTIYTLTEDVFESEFLEAVCYAKSAGVSAAGLVELLTEEEAPNVFSLPVFTPLFCQRFMEEIDQFENSEVPKGRPNTMNRGGILLSEMGFDEGFMNPLRTHYLMPLAKLLYPEWVGEGLDSHRAFIVKYTMEDDVDLSYHFDNAEVTLNVCLGRVFEGGDLYFGSMRLDRKPLQQKQIYKHRIGRGLVHRAQHKHGALPITHGERYNLIVWMRASSVRNRLCPMCNKTPTLVHHEGYGDGFTEQHVHELCNLN